MLTFNRTTGRLLVPFLVMGAAGNAAAQMAIQVHPSQSQGEFSNWPLGLSAATTSAAGQVTTKDNQLLVRAPGVMNGVPTTWTRRKFGNATATHPDYSIAALTDNWGFDITSWSIPLFGGTSTGADVTPPVNPQGVLEMTPTTWYALNISVAPSATGVENSLIRQRGPGVASGDIYSYYPPGSAVISSTLGDSVRIESTREQLGLGVNLSLTSVDYPIGLISTDPGNTAGEIVPIRTTFYFSLTRAWLSAFPTAFQWNAPGGPRRPTALDICCMNWNGTEWSEPVIEYPWTELFPGLSESQVAVNEIDALSVHRTPATSTTPEQDRVVLSLAGSTWSLPVPDYRDQILVHQRMAGQSPLCTTKPLQVRIQTQTGSSTVRIATRLGLNPTAEGGEPDDVTGTCGIDPRGRESTLPPDLGQVVAIALATGPQGEGNMGMAGVRTRLPDPNSNLADAEVQILSTLHFQVTGLDLCGYPFGVVALFAHPQSVGSDDSTPTAPIHFGPVFPVMPGQELSPVSTSFPSIATGGAFLSVSAVLFVFDPVQGSFIPLKSSWVLTVPL